MGWALRPPVPSACAKKSGGHIATAALQFLESCTELYDDLYFTEHPYGFVCGVLTVLPARDSSSAAFT